MKTHKKLIEVALPLVAIRNASAQEKSIRHGYLRRPFHGNGVTIEFSGAPANFPFSPLLEEAESSS